MGKKARVFEIGKPYSGVTVLEVFHQGVTMADWSYRVKCLACGAVTVMPHRSMADRVLRKTVRCRLCWKNKPTPDPPKIVEKEDGMRRYEEIPLGCVDAAVPRRKSLCYTILQPPAIMAVSGYFPYLCDYDQIRIIPAHWSQT